MTYTLGLDWSMQSHYANTNAGQMLGNETLGLHSPVTFNKTYLAQLL